MFTAALVAMYVAYLVVLRNVSSLRGRWVIATILGAHAIFLLAPPMALTDVFNYVNYGRMEVVHHLNPYTTIPILEPHSDPRFALSNWHELLSPYGPLFTLITFAVVPLGVAGSFWALKGLLMVASLATIYLVWRCARLLGRDPVGRSRSSASTRSCCVWGLGGDHNDFLMLFCIMLGFYLLLLGRERWAQGSVQAAPARPREWLLPLTFTEIGAGAAFVTAVALKASAGVLLPVLIAGLLHSRRTLAQVLLGMLIAGLVLGAASLVAFGLHIPDLSTQSRLVTAESIPNLVGLALGQGRRDGHAASADERRARGGRDPQRTPCIRAPRPDHRRAAGPAWRCSSRSAGCCRGTCCGCCRWPPCRPRAGCARRRSCWACT